MRISDWSSDVCSSDLQDFRGRFLLVYFGYTSCPDVCPTELAKLAAALDSLGTAAAEAQPLFITVDPARDTAALLAGYVAHFHPRLVGLTGTAEPTAASQVFFGSPAYRSPALGTPSFRERVCQYVS